MADRLDEYALLAMGGDATAFRALVELANPCLYALSRQLLGDAAEAEDATQEAWLRAYRALPRFEPRGDGAVLAWLRRITLNVCRDWLRRRRGRPLLGSSGSLDLSLPRSGRVGPVFSSDDRQLIREAVLGLPLPYREVIILRYGQDLSYAEISSLVGANERTVATRLRRGLTRLKASLEAEGFDHAATQWPSE